MIQQKENIIDEILSAVRFDYLEELLERLSIDNLAQNKITPCSNKEWDELLKRYNISRYKIATEAFHMEQIQNNEKASIESIKAEVYKIGKIEKREKREKMQYERKPSAKHIEALIKLIEKNAPSYQDTFRLQFILETEKALKLCELIKQYSSNNNIELQSEDVIAYSRDVAKELLSLMDISSLEKIYSQLITEEIELTYEDGYGDSHWDCLLQTSITNLVFFNNHFEVLCNYADMLQFLLWELAYTDENKLVSAYEQLKKKRIYGYDSDCYSDLSKLKYIELDTGNVEIIASEIFHKLSYFPQGEQLIAGMSHLTAMKWNYILLLIRHYEKSPKFPKGKKICDWIDKVQVDI